MARSPRNSHKPWRDQRATYTWPEFHVFRVVRGQQIDLDRRVAFRSSRGQGPAPREENAGDPRDGGWTTAL